MKVIEGSFGVSGIAPDFAAELRKLADAVERGDVGSCVVAATWHGCYTFIKPSSLSESIILTTLLHDSVVRSFREGV